MEKLAAILLMGGSSQRFGGSQNKLLCLLKGKPVFTYSLDVIAHYKHFDKVIVVVNKDIKEDVEAYVNRKLLNVEVIEGGLTRQESVEAALYGMHLSTDYIVVIHDAARPLIDNETIERLVEPFAEKHVAATTTCLPMEDTIAINDDGFISKFVDRKKYVRIQTPQAFRLDKLIEAHDKAQGLEATDDCSLIFENGHEIKLVEGNKKLNKITTQEDIECLEGLLE